MKKYILFMVEGRNDKIEIQAMLRAYYGSEFTNRFSDAYLEFCGDITVDMTEKQILGELTSRVQKWRGGGCEPFHTIAVSDVAKIIHVVDTDGTFIPEDCIMEDDVGNPVYSDTSIRCGNLAFMKGRNRKKSKVICKLLSTKSIDNIPYEIYFASCNMDHVLFNSQNPPQNTKGVNARLFAQKYKERAALQEKIFADGVGFVGTHSESWDFIRSNCNSLQRHTNLNLLLEDIMI